MLGDDRALVDRFCDMLASEAGASLNTLAAYRSDLEAASTLLPNGLGEASMEELQALAPQWSASAST